MSPVRGDNYRQLCLLPRVRPKLEHRLCQVRRDVAILEYPPPFCPNCGERVQQEQMAH